MLYTKYESSGPYSFRQEDFWKFHFKNLFIDPWPTYATNRNGLNNFDRGLPRDHSCEVWSKSNKGFQRRCCLKKLLTDGRTEARTDDGQRTLKDHKSSLSTSCSGELKMKKNNKILLKLYKRMTNVPHKEPLNINLAHLWLFCTLFIQEILWNHLILCAQSFVVWWWWTCLWTLEFEDFLIKHTTIKFNQPFVGIVNVWVVLPSKHTMSDK